MSEQLRCQGCGASLDLAEEHELIARCAYCGANIRIEESKQAVQAEYSREFVVRLFRAIDESFTSEETKELVIQLDCKLSSPYRLDYDDLPGSGQQSKARELVQWCERRGLLQELVDVVVSARPSLNL